MDEALSGDRATPALWILSGMAGVGKTSIAIRAANKFADRFLDGILYANLAGASSNPVETAETLTRFLKDLGVSLGEIPNDYDSLATAYRTLIATKAILVVLDDAANTSQVNDLIPTSPTSAAIITSRRPLTTLPGSQGIPIDVWPLNECVNFLEILLGKARIMEAETDAHELAQLCGRLPIALRIIGAQLIRRPLWPLSRMVGRLHDEQRRLEVLRADDIAIRSVFSTAYQSLSPFQSRVFRTVGLSLGFTFSAESVARMMQSDDFFVEDGLEDLADRYLISPDDTPGRYKIHDLMRLFAKEKAQEAESSQERLDCVHRLLQWYLSVLKGNTPSVRNWVRTERAGLVAGVLTAAEQGWHDLCWRIANELATYHMSESDYTDWVTCNKAGLGAARKCGSRTGQALMLGGLGQASSALNKFNDARMYLEESLLVFREIGDEYGCAEVLWELGKVAGNQWDVARSISAYRESVEISKAANLPYSVRRGIHALGHLYSGISRHDEALACFEEELRLATADDASISHMGLAYQGLAACLAASGMTEQAIDAYDKSIAAARESGAVRDRRIRLTRKAKVLDAMGRAEEANSTYQAALELAREDDDVAGILWTMHYMADALRRQGKEDQADLLYSQILETAGVEDDPESLIGTLHCWGDSYIKRKEFDRAIDLLDRAIAAARRHEIEHELTQILLCRSRVEEHKGNLLAAHSCVREAVHVARSYGSAKILANCLRREGALLDKSEHGESAASSYEEQLGLEVLMQRWPEAKKASDRLSLLWAKLGDADKSKFYANRASNYSAKATKA